MSGRMTPMLPLPWATTDFSWLIDEKFLSKPVAEIPLVPLVVLVSLEAEVLDELLDPPVVADDDFELEPHAARPAVSAKAASDAAVRAAVVANGSPLGSDVKRTVGVQM